jgi:hypothetical protein
MAADISGVNVGPGTPLNPDGILISEGAPWVRASLDPREGEKG